MTGGDARPPRDGDLGAFTASYVYDASPERTAAALELAGQRAVPRAYEAARRDDFHLGPGFLTTIHREWFHDAFPAEAGRFRKVEVYSRRPSPAPAGEVAAHVAQVFEGADEALRAVTDASRPELTAQDAAQVVHIATLLTVQVHHVHPFIDGNTRACWTLRNAVFVRAGLPPLGRLAKEGRHRSAWDAAMPYDTDQLVAVTLDELAAVVTGQP